MDFRSTYPLSSYEDVTPLCEKGHVMLVRNKVDGQLYVKKYLKSYNPEVYECLQKYPVKHTPIIYGIYEDTGVSSEVALSLVMIEEYLAGSTLAELLEIRGNIPEKETIEIGMQLCQILMDLHEKKPSIIHRDIKPSNIIISPEGIVKLLDFNAAKTENSSQKRDTVLLGTEGFAAPEQYGFFPSSPQTDIYALGVLMNLMRTRTMPSEKIADGKLKRVICSCLEMNPKDRYRDVRELYRVLKRMSEVQAEWLLPGFRTMKIPKMLAAIAGYGFLTALIISVGNKFETQVEKTTFHVGLSFMVMAIIMFLFDYMNIQKYFPLMSSSHRWVRILGYILNPTIIFWITMVVITIIEDILL